MRIDLENLPLDPAHLTLLVWALAEEIETATLKISELEEKIRSYQKAPFRRKSEIWSSNQSALDLPGGVTGPELSPERAVTLESNQRRKEERREEARENAKKARRGIWPENAEVVTKIIPPDRDTCPECNGALNDAGETSGFTLEYIPASIKVINTIRPKCACRKCGELVQAKAPPRLANGCLAEPSLVAWILVSRYSDHTPFYRMHRILERSGANIARSTMVGWATMAASLLEPLYQSLLAHIKKSPRIHADETRLPTLKPGLGKTHTGYMWTYVTDDSTFGGKAPPAAIFCYEEGRGKKYPLKHLEGWSGVLQVDGYAGYNELERLGHVLLMGCWAHLRRLFFELAEEGSPLAADKLDQFKELYILDRHFKGLSPEERVEGRDGICEPLVTEMFNCLPYQLSGLSKTGKLFKAIEYMRRQRDKLVLFLTNGYADLDNNPVERVIRSVALGRKNSLFAGSEVGARNWAVIASLIETAKLNGVEPFAWLRDTLTKIMHGHPPDRADELLPFPATG
ncbi:transposase [Acetobacter nitrogenifigens DSM 23921 = NBRC 105050]|uniref:Transposase n=1 Tax=Acetobacter nitrogenifigens DSM 23921 = NBRC 105050 TaxID=1120919 RepID=A0A511XEP4_9PROT|nr:IS66 family transposase [Acetobacter nitrogenifigens]GBQ94356.1 transposase [Acetobacter nitrogenifigens DSM 23921 = NBRC 105050]GEN61423.1 transposase [Acetobacter nitrogenifigens DSM 23921 = NBRC 105050]